MRHVHVRYTMEQSEVYGQHKFPNTTKINKINNSINKNKSTNFQFFAVFKILSNSIL